MLRRGGGITRAQAVSLLSPGLPAGQTAWMAEGAAQSIAIPAVDLVYLYFFRVYSRIVVNLIGARTNTGGAGSAVKSALWRNNPTTGRPSSIPVLGQNAGFDTTATGNDTAAIANVPLEPGVYWGGSKCTGTPPTMLCISNQFLGINAASLTTGNPNIGYSVPDAYANDIMALDLTGATFTPVGSGIPVIGLGWV
jgi:hypothetical protein